MCAFEPSFIRRPPRRGNDSPRLICGGGEGGGGGRGPEVSRYLRQAILLERDKQGRQTDDKSGLIKVEVLLNLSQIF